MKRGRSRTRTRPDVRLTRAGGVTPIAGDAGIVFRAGGGTD